MYTYKHVPIFSSDCKKPADLYREPCFAAVMKSAERMAALYVCMYVCMCVCMCYCNVRSAEKISEVYVCMYVCIYVCMNPALPLS